MIFRTVMVCTAFIAAMIGYSVYDGMRWQEFSESHECVTVSKIDGYYITSPSYSPVLKTWTTSQVYYPGHTHYKCNDGKEYAR